jgi:hypothetical protein
MIARTASWKILVTVLSMFPRKLTVSILLKKHVQNEHHLSNETDNA